ncbi:MAG: hypothetical protein JXA81_02900 [Sedimentisphaerales bacterium]|nr:hypothetical protein [Sedimentisphaerales bacterium]
MNIPNFKDVLQKLSVIKNNLSLLVPIIIALVSVLLFIPTQLMSSKLKKDVEQKSINDSLRKIKNLETSAVSRQQYEMEAERQKAHAADANEVVKLAMQTTQRELLSYNIFPAPDPNGFSGLIFQKFGENFRTGIDNLILSVNARDCPTDAEIERGLENSSSSSRTRGRGLSSMMSSSRYGGNSGMDLYGGGGSMMLGNINRMIIDEMCKDRAKTISVYINPLDIAGYEYWTNYKYDVKQEDAIKDCFYHQLAYWIIDDIFQTIAKMNSGYDTVLTAQAKRFMGITFTMGLKSVRKGGGVFRPVRGSRRTTTSQSKIDEADRPHYVRDIKSEGLSESYTGRKCNEDIHVTHFNFSIIISTKSVLPFMKELCSAKEHQFRGYPHGAEPPQKFKHNQITVLESKMGSINPNDMTHRYYRYGDDPVVSLDLICEYVFDKEGYDVLIPQPVKDTLAGKDEAK